MRNNKPEPKKIGNVNGFEVMQYGDSPCLVIGKTWLSLGKVETVLDNRAACEEFRAKFKKAEQPKPAPAPAPAPAPVPQTKEALLAQIAMLQAQAAELIGKQPGNNRVDAARL